MTDRHGLTPTEDQILRRLADAWNLWVDLDARDDIDNHEMMSAIHQAQKMVALRVARRVNPETWRQVL
jgi:hypothetical protein